MEGEASMRRFKKLLSLVLSAALLLGCLETSVFAATADFTFDVTKIEKYSEETHDVLADEVTSVKEGDIIVVTLSFSNHTTSIKKIGAYAACLLYDGNIFTPYTDESDTEGAGLFWEGPLADVGGSNFIGSVAVSGMVTISGGTASGVTVRAGQSAEFGKIAFKVSKNLRATEAVFKFDAAYADNELADSVTNPLDFGMGDEQSVTVYGQPYLTASAKADAKFYDTTTLEQLKAGLAVQRIDEAGKATDVTDFTVSVTDWKTGENTVTVTAGGLSTTVTVTAVADTVEFIEKGSQPTKGLVYTSGETLDLSGMTIKVYYASGIEKIVGINDNGCTTEPENGTTLTVNLHNTKKITVTYEKKMVETWALTVNPRPVTVPTAEGTYTYTGEEQTFTIGKAGDKAYYTITGSLTGTEAGTYTATASLKDKTETQWDDTAKSTDDKTLTWKIQPNANALALERKDSSTIIYNGQEQTPAYTVKSGSAVLTAGTDYTLSYSNNTNAGTATVTATGLDNYAGATGSAEFTIAKAAVALTWSGADTRTYDGKASNVTASVTNKIGNDDVTVTVTGGDAVNAGTYTAAVAGLAGAKAGNYQLPEEGLTQSYTINRAALTIASVAVEGKTYDGTTDAKVTSVTFNGLQNGEELVSGTDYTVAGVFDEADVGERTVTVTVTMRDTAKAKNYQLEKTTATATATITPVQTTLELTAKDAVYTGSAYDAKNISKISNVNDAPVYTYYADSNGAKGDALNTAPVNAGTYWVEGYIAASGNNSAVTSAAVKFQIAKAPLTATAEDQSVTYGEEAPNYTVLYAGFVNNETESVVTGLTFDCAYAAGSDAGEYAITPKGATADNYAITFVEGKLTVGKLTAALAWNDYAERTYDGKASNVTASVTNKIGNDDVTVTVTGGTAVNAGTYIATATGLAGDKAKNYQLPETGLSQGYTINRAALTIASVAVEGKTYDGTTDAKVTSVTFNGLQNGEELVSGTDYTVAGVFAEADVGERTVTVTVTMRDTAKAKNYQLEKTTATATATITPVQTTLELTAKDAVYTGSAYDAETKLTASANVENPDITYTYYADSNGAKGDALSTAPVNAGTYWVEGYIAASGNNSEVTSDAVQFQITQAPLTATAENKSATYGDTAPAYTVRYAGFVNGETASVVTGLITFDCAYAAGSDAGEYAITPKGATADNYAITFVAGKLTVGKRTAALEWSGYAERTYDGKASSVTASVTNKIGNDDVTVTVTGGDAVNAGTYTAAATGLAGAKAGNYQLPEAGLTQSYTIGKAARTLSGLADLTLAGDTLSAALQPKVNDLDQSALFTYESSNTAAVTVNAQGVVSAVANGTATVTVTVPATANYEAAETSVTVKAVTQAITAVSAAPDTVSAALQGKTIVLSGYAESITVTPTYYDGVRLKSGSLTVKAGETAGIVLTVDGRDIPWTIDASAVVVKPANVTVATDDEVAKAPDADETITDEVLNTIAGGNTTASGLDQAAAGLIPEAAKNAPEGTAAVELTFVTQILPESYQNGVLVLEIRPVAQYKYLDQQGNAIKTEEKAIANSDIQGLVTLSVQLPAGMPVADLYARHDLGGGQYEYLPVTVENGAATWQQGSFSRVSLIADARSAAVTFRMPDGSEQTVTYTPENIGQSLPAASRAGYRFDGWKFPGIDGTYKTLTDELLTALNGKTLTAEAQFTVMGGGGGGGGGFVSAGYAVSIAKTENGTVTASAETAEEGETITLTVKAETGYVLKTLTAAAEGKDLTLTAGKNGTYTFTMPAADVTVTAVFEKISFADVKSGSYCYDAVQWAVAKGITLGMSDGSFAPNAPCTRGQIVTFLWRAMGCPAPKSTVNPFTDVKSGSYCYEAVLWAVEQGITKGTTATTFSPNAACTRGQAVTFLCRAVGTEGTGDTGFADVGANSFCAGSVKWAVENGVTKGTTATTFSPNETCTRGQIVTFLYRAMGK